MSVAKPPVRRNFAIKHTGLWIAGVVGIIMALRSRMPEWVVHHVGQGSQYASIAIVKRCEAIGCRWTGCRY